MKSPNLSKSREYQFFFLVMSKRNGPKVRKVLASLCGQTWLIWILKGIPPGKTKFSERSAILSREIVLFDYKSNASVHNADDTKGHIYHSESDPSYACAPGTATAKDKVSRKIFGSRVEGYSKSQPSTSGQAQPHSSYCVFTAGDYIFNFEIPVHSSMPGTIMTDLGHVRYELKVNVQRSGAFQPRFLRSVLQLKALSKISFR